MINLFLFFESKSPSFIGTDSFILKNTLWIFGVVFCDCEWSVEFWIFFSVVNSLLLFSLNFIIFIFVFLIGLALLSFFSSLFLIDLFKLLFLISFLFFEFILLILLFSFNFVLLLFIIKLFWIEFDIILFGGIIVFGIEGKIGGAKGTCKIGTRLLIFSKLL